MSETCYNCIVVTVSLRPSPISDENACFGVILKCDKAGFFSYRLAQQDEAVISRITNFFPRYGREKLLQIMEWAANDIEFTIKNAPTNLGAFQNLIRPRENIIRYGSPSAVATDDPAAELDRQYDIYVVRR